MTSSRGRTARDAPNAPAATILLVDDDPYVRESVRDVLEFEGYLVHEAADGKAALDTLHTLSIDLMLLDLELPRISGMDVLRQIAATNRRVAVVIASGRGSIRTAVDATRLGALEFIEKPIDAEHMLEVVRQALGQLAQIQAQQRALDEAAQRYGLVGISPAMQQVYALIDRAATVTAKVLITGESGTGKELTARAIHTHSRQATGPLVSVNCAAIPETLIESELFGYQKGAFTGAASNRRGRLEQANGGTLFLDEVGDMSLMTQAKVLRALEDGTVHRIGGETQVRLDFRLIAATNRELAAEIERGNFREDLYYRLNVIHIELPPLRARREDIMPLAEHLVKRACSRNNLPSKHLGPPALGLLTACDWPGNVRELQNVIERLIVLSESETIGVRDVRRALDAPRVHSSGRASGGLREARDEFERAYIRAALRKNNGHIQETADELGINRSHLWRKMRALGVDTEHVAQ